MIDIVVENFERLIVMPYRRMVMHQLILPTDYAPIDQYYSHVHSLNHNHYLDQVTTSLVAQSSILSKNNLYIHSDKSKI